MAMKVFWGWRCCVCRFIFGIESEIVFTVHLEICRTALLDDWSWQVSLVLYFFGFLLSVVVLYLHFCLFDSTFGRKAGERLEVSSWRVSVRCQLVKASWGKLRMGGDICLGSLQPLRGWRAFILPSCSSSSSSSSSSQSSTSSSHHYHLCRHGGH